MRRNSTDQNNLEIFLLSIILVFSQALALVYVYIPSFAGVFFVYAIIHYDNYKKRYFIYASFAYLIFYELTRGFYLFSYLLTFLLFYNIFVAKIRNNFSCKNCISFIYIACAYIGHYFINTIISIIVNEPTHDFSNHYFYYMLVDWLLCIILFRGRV
ncbi:MAG: hypothetical protein IBX44_06605 [Sulfurospirillum sp.]|nr:hypothetical protein [Sulfurospirillum sp.]